MNMTRIAPRNARFSQPSASHLAIIDTMLARAAALGIGKHMTASATNIASTEPAPAAPSTLADTDARLNAQDAQLQDHEARIAGLEQRSPPPAGNAGDSQAAAPAAAAATAMIDTRALYARMNAQSAGLKAGAPAASAVIQTSAGPMLDTRAMYARLNADATARADRGRRG